MYASFLRLRATASARTGLHSPAFTHRAGPMMNSRSQPVTPRACCNRSCTRGEGLRSPRISCERYPAEIPAAAGRLPSGLCPVGPAAPHTATALSFTLHREGRFRLISACFLSCQVPLFLPPGARVIRRRRAPSTAATPGLPRGNWTAALPVWVCFPPFSFQPGPSAMRAGSSVALEAELRAMAGLLPRPRGR